MVALAAHVLLTKLGEFITIKLGKQAKLRGKGFTEEEAKAILCAARCRPRCRRRANYESLFARKPQISLAFDPQESNGRDVLRIDPPIG